MTKNAINMHHTIFNIMLSAGQGGIEQVFLDYNRALVSLGYNVVAVTHPRAHVNKHIRAEESCAPRGVAARSEAKASQLTERHLPNFGQYDVFAAYRLRGMLKAHHADLIITHGNRAFTLSKLARSGAPILAVSHNYKYRRLLKADHIICITEHMRNEIVARGYPAAQAHRLYNPIHYDYNESPSPKARNGALTIGFMSRFVHKKGGAVLLESLSALKPQLEFHALFAGHGELEAELRAKAASLGLSDEVTFCGWVDDKDTFFKKLDILVVPSLHEPFGVIVLDGLARATPVIATSTEGPTEIIQPGENGMLVPPGDSQALASAILTLANAPESCRRLASAGLSRAREFHIDNFRRRLNEIVKQTFNF